MIPDFLANNPSLRRRYKLERLRLGSSCSGCAQASLNTKFRRLAVQELIAKVPKKKRRA